MARRGYGTELRARRRQACKRALFANRTIDREATLVGGFLPKQLRRLKVNFSLIFLSLASSLPLRWPARRAIARLGSQPLAKKLALAIVGAEFVLRWLEPETPRWKQFVTPIELTGFTRAAGLRGQGLRGRVYEPLRRAWRLLFDTAVNYPSPRRRRISRFEASSPCPEST
jgi:hypothetical protein